MKTNKKFIVYDDDVSLARESFYSLCVRENEILVSLLKAES